ncbi:class I SAM-dependent methyltransferase [Candidatus Dojkabacteria bacterium]|nr:class I SAM-dependent methyltransferase [Candidatus Dojkabacteria bacterium]
MTKQPEVSDYDKSKYDYTTYWKSREYEHQAETALLDRIFKRKNGQWIIDIGGGFGRLVKTYHQKYHKFIICDYSTELLNKAQIQLREQGIKNGFFVAANIYNLPFKQDIIDTVLMVRVAHHLEDISKAVNELTRIIMPKGDIVLEFANKLHIKNRLKHLLKFDFDFFFSGKPYKHKTGENAEGTDRKSPGIFYNFDYRHLKREIVSHEMTIKRTYPLSFFRINLAKKLIPLKLLIFLEKLAQNILFWTKITPSVVIEASKQVKRKQTAERKSIESIICCPNCKGDFKQQGRLFICNKCNLKFKESNNIIDLRYPNLNES